MAENTRQLFNNMLIETINKQIDWYYKFSTKASLTDIADLNDKLSSNLYTLIEEYDNAHKDFITKYTNYKKTRGEGFLKTKYGTTEKKMTEREIESILDRDTSTEFADRLFAEAYLAPGRTNRSYKGSFEGNR